MSAETLSAKTPLLPSPRPFRLHEPASAGAWRLVRLALVAAAVLLALPLMPSPASALTGTRPDAGEEAAPGAAPSVPGEGQAPRTLHKAPKDKRTQLEGLFAALKVAPDDRSAKIIGDRLDQLFNTTDSASVDLLMIRASVAMEAKQYDLAIKIMSQAIEIDPDDIGALSKRATIYYMRDDYGAALADIREVLAREPRHFTMLYALALILRDIGDDKMALEAARKALDVNPHLDGAKELADRLSPTVEGRDI